MRTNGFYWVALDIKGKEPEIGYYSAYLKAWQLTGAADVYFDSELYVIDEQKLEYSKPKASDKQWDDQKKPF